MKRIVFLLIFLCFTAVRASSKEVNIYSPDKRTTVVLNDAEGISINVKRDGIQLMGIGNISLVTDRGRIPAEGSTISKITTQSVDRVVVPEIKEKFSQIPERYNQSAISLRNGTSVIVRVYDNGFAYRLVTSLEGEVTVYNENADLIFDAQDLITYQQDRSMNSDYEAPYITKALSDMPDGEGMGNLPALVQTGSGKSVLVLESDLKDYPCMWIKKEGGNLKSHFWGYPKTLNPEGNFYNRRKITSVEDYIAITDGTREYPWRVFAIADEDTDLLKNQLVYLLAPECKLLDTSWIKPGWVTFDWWARRGLYGVDFKAGINNATARYMIDFASNFGIRYFLFDDGWTKGDDLTQVVDGLDIPEVVKYADSKGVDVMLWVTYDHFDAQMETALEKFSQWGIKGLKIDFINRSDQAAVDFYWRSAEMAAKYEMVIDYHGAYRPDGMRRAYPNVLTREALIEFEYSGATDYDNPDHHCTLPFIRNVAGPMDYIPGTMLNSTRRSFRPHGDYPYGQGTRAHSMAMAVICESPMQMLPDPQSEYYREKECTEFITQVPVEWDEIVPLKGRVGDYVALARRKGTTWYLAAITDWTSRDMELELDFLDAGCEYTAEVFSDGVNADIRAIDYKRDFRKLTSADQIMMKLAPGGGWVARISK